MTSQPALGSRLDGVDLVALGMLCAVAERGSLSAAGVQLGVTQQAVSARMRRLEQSLGVALLDRSPSGSRLTANGEVIAGWAADVLAAAERLADGAAALRGRAAEDASVAASLTVSEYLLPRWLTRLRAASPETRIAAEAVNSAAVLRLVAEGVHPLGFVETPEAAPGLRTTRIAWDELIVVVAPAHPWARRRGVTAAELAATPLVARESGSGTRLAAERALRGAGLDPVRPAAELPTSSGIRTAVASGLAPAVLSILTVRDDLDAGRLVRVPVTDLRIVRELRAVQRPDVELPSGVRALLRIAKTSGRTD